MPDVVLKDRLGTETTYRGVDSVVLNDANGEQVKFYALKNPITVLVEGVEYTLENASDLTETDEENTYTVKIN